MFPVRSISNYFQYLDISQKRIDALEIEISKLQIENQSLRRNLELLSLPDTIIQTHFRLLKANIIGRDPTNFGGFLYIDKGITDSLNINDPVIIQNKLVGRIKSLSEKTGIVETFENKGFSISAVDGKTGVYGIIKQNDVLALEYIKLDDEINYGDSILTSGLSEIFPKGILIGTVSEIKRNDDPFFKKVVITPAIKVNQLNYVYIVY
ncbi:MAG: rod shape-determining protein MreC [bacterium]